MRNKYEVRGEVVIIYLQGNKQTIIDTEDLPKLLKLDCRWTHYIKSSGKEGALSILAFGGKRSGKPLSSKVVHLHRFIAESPAKFVVLHKDGNGLNNRKENLRFAIRGTK